MNKVYYYIDNFDDMIHKTSETKYQYKVERVGHSIFIEILNSDSEVIDKVSGYDSLGDLMESINGGNDLE